MFVLFFLNIQEPPIGAFNSPTIGDRNAATIRVTKAEANGEIGFDTIVPMIANEPPDTAAEVRLRLTREGTSGRATISWSMVGTGNNAGQVTSSDTGPTTGTVIMGSGILWCKNVCLHVCMGVVLKFLMQTVLIKWHTHMLPIYLTTKFRQEISK